MTAERDDSTDLCANCGQTSDQHRWSVRCPQWADAVTCQHCDGAGGWLEPPYGWVICGACEDFATDFSENGTYEPDAGKTVDRKLCHPAVIYVCDSCHEKLATTWVRVFGRYFGLVCSECSRAALTPGGPLADLERIALAIEASEVARLTQPRSTGEAVQ